MHDHNDEGKQRIGFMRVDCDSARCGTQGNKPSPIPGILIIFSVRIATTI